MREALYYEPHGTGVVCRLCPKGCHIGQGQTGFCRVRKNIGGKLFAQNYAACSAYALDPIEKKPLYHFYPGSHIVSVGTWGCNFQCRFCQNWQIAQDRPAVIELTPGQLVEAAVRQETDAIGIAYTYSEPSVWYEYILDTARAAKQQGLKNVLVTNGFINPEPLAELLPYIDAMNIDVKAFNDQFYHTVCSGELAAVQRTVELAVSRCHVEITTLLVPDCNDSPEEIMQLAQWLAGIHPEIPLHFSRYFPTYQMKAPPTPLATLQQAYTIASRFMHYVYIGNVSGTEGINTQCPACKEVVIDRIGRQHYLTKDKKCANCGTPVAVIGEICF